MKITVNGRSEDLEKQMSVIELLKRLKVEPVRVAVEINEEIVSRKNFLGTVLNDGDRIEIVTFVGGG